MVPSTCLKGRGSGTLGTATRAAAPYLCVTFPHHDRVGVGLSFRVIDRSLGFLDLIVSRNDLDVVNVTTSVGLFPELADRAVDLLHFDCVKPENRLLESVEVLWWVRAGKSERPENKNDNEYKEAKYRVDAENLTLTWTHTHASKSVRDWRSPVSDP
jgi:hypothetical protein